MAEQVSPSSVKTENLNFPLAGAWHGLGHIYYYYHPRTGPTTTFTFSVRPTEVTLDICTSPACWLEVCTLACDHDIMAVVGTVIQHTQNYVLPVIRGLDKSVL